MQDVFTIANKNYKSRLIVGTGKYKDFKQTADAVKASGADIVTVAVRRVNISDKSQPLLMDYLNPKSITWSLADEMVELQDGLISFALNSSSHPVCSKSCISILKSPRQMIGILRSFWSK